jgi:hypothetical protein
MKSFFRAGRHEAQTDALMIVGWTDESKPDTGARRQRRYAANAMAESGC